SDGNGVSFDSDFGISSDGMGKDGGLGSLGQAQGGSELSAGGTGQSGSAGSAGGSGSTGGNSGAGIQADPYTSNGSAVDGLFGSGESIEEQIIGAFQTELSKGSSGGTSFVKAVGGSAIAGAAIAAAANTAVTAATGSSITGILGGAETEADMAVGLSGAGGSSVHLNDEDERRKRARKSDTEEAEVLEAEPDDGEEENYRPGWH
ncbi:MAG: hypothetical protein Q4B22_12030, partial [Eubacteriales bacterium]|nr:hypothetical protein [Eubacteriales bacterium]